MLPCARVSLYPPCLAACITFSCGGLSGCGADHQGPPAAATPEPTAPVAAAAIVVQRFEIKTEVHGNELTVRLDTDLPPTTELMLRIDRSYWRRDHGEAVEYTEEYGKTRNLTAAQAAETLTVDISDTVFNQMLAESKRTAATLGETFNLDHIAPDITILVMVGSPQKLPFAPKNANLSGVEVRKLSEFGGQGIDKSVNVQRPLGFHDVEAERLAHEEASRTPFPGLADTLVPRLVVAALPDVLARALKNPEYADTEMPLDRAGFVMNDLNDACAYTQQTIKGVRYFYQPPPGVVADSMGVIIFKDPHCMCAHVPGAGLVATANHVNAEIAKVWLSAPERATVAVSQLKIPKDKSVQGLCLKSFASAYALVQYVIKDGSIVAVVHTGGEAPDGCSV
jgi:hypothetical protein